MKEKVCNPNYRIDLEFVEFSELTKFQAKLNQWLTKGELVKFETSLNDKGVLFKVCRKKGA